MQAFVVELLEVLVDLQQVFGGFSVMNYCSMMPTNELAYDLDSMP